MKTIFKTWKKATYIKGRFLLRENENMHHPVDFPIVFTAYGKGIKSGNFHMSTAINTPNYVINYYFDNIGHDIYDAMYSLWDYCKQLEKLSWEDVKKDKNNVLALIELANIELQKLEILK